MNSNNYRMEKPILVLAPMANITTYPFASQCVKYGADLVFTPMVHTDTIINNWPEAEKILNFEDPNSHPEHSEACLPARQGSIDYSVSPQNDKYIGIKNYVVQIIGSEPDKVSEAIKIIDKKLKPKGIDLNFACPDKNIIKSGCGGYLMQYSDKIVEICKAAKRSTKLPISIKTRAGWDNHTDIFNILNLIQKEGINTVTIHPRTVKSGFLGVSDWNIIKEVVKMYPKLNIIGSGNIETWQDALEKQRVTKCFGVMIGRGALGKPWLFKEIKDKKDYISNFTEIKKLALDLTQKAHDIWGDKGITESKKHFAWYFKGFPGASSYRKGLMETKNLKEVKSILEN